MSLWPSIRRRTYTHYVAPLEAKEKPLRVKDLTGQRFGKWTVLGYHGRKVYAQEHSVADYWRVKCDCGTESSVQGRSLRAETSRQCLRCSKGVPRKSWWKVLGLELS
jgi:hypothetical protein